MCSMTDARLQNRPNLKSLSWQAFGIKSGNNMKTLPKILGRAVLVSLVTVGLAAGSAVAASPAASAAALSRIHIDNFGKVDDLYYRGSQPDRADYTDLAALGVKTVIDLQADGSSKEKGMVEQAGMSFYRI